MSTKRAETSRPIQRRGPSCLLLALGAVGLLLVLAVVVVLADRRDPGPPSPAGLVLLVQAPEVPIPFGTIQVQPAPGGRPAFMVWADRSSGPADPVEYAYPHGGATPAPGFVPPLAPRSPFGEQGDLLEPTLDLDGDGVIDRVYEEGGLHDRHSLVRVRSGADGRLLFTDRDELEYENPRRAYPLGDLDGDGYGELAITYPRNDRSYDLHPSNMLFDTHSWVAVVSGSRMDFPPPVAPPDPARQDEGP